MDHNQPIRPQERELINSSRRAHCGHRAGGQVGSGKSLFLNAILGEAVQIEGSTTISSAEISYCAQTPWLENLSGIKTVLRSADCDIAWLKSVTWACALEDVKGLKEYAEGSIGTGGMALSGGQKQRLVSCNSPSPQPSV
jgi:ATP-binding cassette subfamily C (CFTR/MRP) protein 1